MEELLYGTGNPAKFEYMRECLAPLPIKLLSLRDMPLPPPEAAEVGRSPLENAREKASLYFRVYRVFVFSCDSGLYFEDLSPSLQPGVHVRRPFGKKLSDEEMTRYYASLAEKYGGERGLLRARYKNAVSLFLKDGRRFECEDDSLCGESFFLASVPHRKREEGFPLDRLSVDERTGAYYYDSGERAAGDAFEGFRRFFAVCFGL